MIDTRTKKLAKLIVGYSLNVKHDESVIISGSSEAEDFILALYREILEKGAHPILRLSLPGLSPIFYKYAKEHHLKKFPEYFDYTVKNAQKYIGINTESNTRELSSADPKKIVERENIMRPISDYIVNQKDKIRRVSVGYPCLAHAQEAEMSLHEYEDFVFGAMLQDWDKASKQINKILSYFKKGKTVRLFGKDVDLKFDIKGEKADADRGEENMPGGEIFMAPIRTSAEGFIKFNYPAIEAGNEVSGIYLEFHKGKIVKARAEKNQKFLHSMINVDKNASYLGEFGIGLNSKIKKFTKNLLFDEKIGGTIHLALGMAYRENGGGNDSAIHWDIVKNMKRAKIVLDGRTIQEGGRWVI